MDTFHFDDQLCKLVGLHTLDVSGSRDGTRIIDCPFKNYDSVEIQNTTICVLYLFALRSKVSILAEVGISTLCFRR